MSDDPQHPRKRRRSAAPYEQDDSEDWLAQDDEQWQRPGDRFPMLPDEEPVDSEQRQAALKDPPRPRPIKTTPPRKPGNDLGRNLIALFFLLATCGVITYFVLIWQNPYSTLNPLAPPTPLPQVITATYTPSHTPTPSPTRIPSATLTPSQVPTEAPTMTYTPIFLEGFSTPDSALNGTPAPTEDPSTYRFSLQSNRIVYITNPDARGGCNWSSIAGSVTNFDGSALNGYGVHVFGEGVDVTIATGSAPGFGPGGFEVELGSVARDAQFVAQLIDPQGVSVSPVYTVETSSDCELNIAALRFVETAPSS